MYMYVFKCFCLSFCFLILKQLSEKDVIDE